MNMHPEWGASRVASAPLAAAEVTASAARIIALMVTVAERKAQLAALIEAIGELLPFLAGPDNPWEAHFRDLQDRATRLLTSGPEGDDALRSLSTAVTSLFDPKDAGFPGWPPSGEAEARIRSRVHDCALELRVVGRV